MAKQALVEYGDSVSYSLLYKDIYPEDSANVKAVLQGLDSESITRDAAITAIVKESGLSRDEIESRYDLVMSLQAATAALAGVYGVRSLSAEAPSTSKGAGSKVDATKGRVAGTIDQATTGIEWGKGIKGQGMPWEDYLGTQMPAGSRLPPNFKTFDFFDEATGLATSAKTLDTTTAAKVANPSQVYSSTKGNIDAAANFVEAGLKGVTFSSNQITARELQIAIPNSTTSAQWDQINRAIQYGQSKGVTVKITKVD